MNKNNTNQNNSEMENMRQQNFNTNPYVNNKIDTSGYENISQTQNPYYNNQVPNQMVNQVPNTQQPKTATDSLLGSFDTEDFIKGALIGAVGAYLLTNETAQKAIFKGVAKTTTMFQAGMEEMKERYEDAQAELEAEREA